VVAFFLKKKTNYTIRGWYTLRIETRNFGGEVGPAICWLASRWWRRRLGQHWTPRAQQQQMTVSIWKALHQSAECVASALDMQLFFPPPLAVHLSLNDADFNILAFTFVINAMPSRASQSITPNPPTVLFDCCGLMDVQSITIRTVPLSTAKEPYWHCHHSSIGILLLFSSERRTQHLSDWLKPNFFIFLFLFIYVKFRSSSHFGFGDVETNVSIGRNCQIGLPHPRDADAHRRVVQGQYLLCTTFHFGVFFRG
jgi:hypothetical protein